MYNMMKRENEIIEILGKFAENDLDFVVIGGYAVSAFRHRFSIDADIVIRRKDKEGFENVMKENNYRKTMNRKLENIYSSEFIRYEKRGLKVNIDLLIDAVGTRQTGATFSIRILDDNSSYMVIEGLEKSVKVKVPRREILIILKLHSGRLTDLRDVAALSYNLDFNLIRKYLFIGDTKKLNKTLKKLSEIIEKPEFRDSFKGVFMEKDYRIDFDEIRKLTRLSL